MCPHQLGHISLWSDDRTACTTGTMALCKSILPVKSYRSENQKSKGIVNCWYRYPQNQAPTFWVYLSFLTCAENLYLCRKWDRLDKDQVVFICWPHCCTLVSHACALNLSLSGVPVSNKISAANRRYKYGWLLRSKLGFIFCNTLMFECLVPNRQFLSSDSSMKTFQ